MHRNLNISTEEGARHPKYDKISHMNQHTLKTEYDKENTHYSYSPTTVSPKKSLECQLHENSPRFTHHQDSFEDSNNVSNNNYAEQYHSKRHSELRDNTQNRRNTVQHNSFSGNNEGFEKVRNCNENDVKLLKQEVIALRRSLNEAQGKANVISKEFSKVQHENSLFQSQLRRSELKIKELIEGHATDQAKISELTLQRNQLHNEVAKLRTELYDINKAKENVENLKKSLSDVENLIEYKNKKMFKHMKQLNFGLGTLQGIISSSDSPRSDHCQHLFEKLQEIMGNILNVSGCTDLEELNNMQESNGFHTMAKFREAMSEYENENTELKDHIIYLDNLLQKEELKNKELLPQYKESIDKLRKNVVKIKEQLKETQQQRKEDRKQFFEKLHEVEMVNKELMEENMALKAVNEELTEKAKNNEMLVLHNEEKVKKLTKDYKKLEASIKSIQKNNAVSPSYSTLNNKRTPQGESTALAPQKEPRSRSRDYSALNRTLTEGDESFSQNPPPRSSSVARRRVEVPENNQRNHKIYQKPISTDITIDKIYQGCQTFSDNRSQDIGSLNKTFELERARINHARKNSENRSNHPALPTGKFRGNYESTPHYYIEDNSQIVEDKEALENIECGRGYFSNQVDRSYSRQARNTSKYERTHKDLSVMTSFGGDLKNEIASLDNEIGEIQKYMLDGLDMEDNN